MSESASQAVRFPCPECGQFLSAEKILRGTKQLCPHCRKLVLVPADLEVIKEPPPIQLEDSADYKSYQQQATSSPMNPPVQTTEENDVELWGPGEAAPVVQQSYIPVHCRVCDTRMYATTNQVGEEITCPDCGAKTKVKMSAAKATSSVMPDSAGDDYELSEPAPGLTLEKLGYGAQKSDVKGSPYDTNALAEAAKADQAIRRARKMPAKNWMLRGVYLYPFRPSILVYAVLITSMGVGMIYVTSFVDFLSGVPFAAIASVFLVVIDSALAMLGGGYLGALLVAVIEVASDGQQDIEDDLDLMFTDRLFRMLFIVSAWVCAAAPGVLVDFLAGAPEAWQLNLPLNMSLFSLISLYLLLPWTQLSVLEASSMVVPVSLQVLRSARRKPLAWLAFYGMSSLIIVAAGGLIALVSLFPQFLALWLGLLIVVLGLVAYYRLLGRLAWYCAAYTESAEETRKSDPYEPLYP